jgi:hypothetical protein
MTALPSPAIWPERRTKWMLDDSGNWKRAEIDRTGNTETFIRWLPELDFTLTPQEIANVRR